MTQEKEIFSIWSKSNVDEAQIHVEISTFFGMRLNFKSTQNFLGGCYDDVIYIKKLLLDKGMTLVKKS